MAAAVVVATAVVRLKSNWSREPVFASRKEKVRRVGLFFWAAPSLGEGKGREGKRGGRQSIASLSALLRSHRRPLASPLIPQAKLQTFR